MTLEVKIGLTAALAFVISGALMRVMPDCSL